MTAGSSTSMAKARPAAARPVPARTPAEPIEIPDRTWTVWAMSINLFIAFTRVLALRRSPLDLLPDEAQYWSWSRHLAFGYFSKPPVVAWLISATTALAGNDEWGVRLAAPLVHAATGIVIALIGRATSSTPGSASSPPCCTRRCRASLSPASSSRRTCRYCSAGQWRCWRSGRSGTSRTGAGPCCLAPRSGSVSSPNMRWAISCLASWSSWRRARATGSRPHGGICCLRSPSLLWSSRPIFSGMRPMAGPRSAIPRPMPIGGRGPGCR